MVTNISYKINDVLSSKCAETIGDSKPAHTSPYDGTEPVILLRPEDMHPSLNYQPTIRSTIYITVFFFTNDF